MRRALAVAAALLAACVPEDGPLMEPGQDCLECHSGGEGPTWTVAGTFGGKGSRVTITDANGRSFTVRTAENGNFYTAESVAYPITVSVDGERMEDPVPAPTSPPGTTCVESHCCAGSRCGCNDCHGPGHDDGGTD